VDPAGVLEDHVLDLRRTLDLELLARGAPHGAITQRSESRARGDPSTRVERQARPELGSTDHALRGYTLLHRLDGTREHAGSHAEGLEVPTRL
jgi:hypothetical protein